MRVRGVPPRGRGVVLVEVDVLLVLPPAVAPLKDHAADGVLHPTLAVALLVDLLPLGLQVLRLGDRIFDPAFRVERVGAKLGVHERKAELLFDAFEDVPGRRAAVDVAAEHIDVGALLFDDLDEPDVAVGDGHRVVLVRSVNQVRDLPKQRIQEDCTRITLLRLRQIFDLVGLPVKSVIVLVAEQPHQKAGRVFVLLNQRRHLLLHERPKALVGVVDRADPGAVDRHAVAAHGVVQDRVDAVLLVDVRDPPRRNARGTVG